MTLNEKVLKKLPKKYHDRFLNLEPDIDLVDDCNYMLWRTKDYTDGDTYGGCYPVRNISEAINFIKNSLFK